MIIALLLSAATVTQVADRVWVIRHDDSPDGYPQSNTTLIAAFL